MIKIVSAIQSIIGVSAILSFFAVFVSIFVNKDYCIFFFSLFFILLPISIFLNKFTKGYKFSAGYYFLLVVLIVMGLAGSYFTVKTFQTYTVYTLNLENKGANLFEGSFNSPKDFALDNSKYTFYTEVGYGFSMRTITSEWLTVDFTNPGGSSQGLISFSSNEKGSTGFSSLRQYSQYNFQGVPGDYIFKVYPKEKLGNHLIVRSVKILIRKFR
ncbi:MAG: hypothetical protein WCP24_02660 [bacterium]